MSIPVVWLTFNPETIARHYWNQSLVEALLDGSVWRPQGAFTFEHHVLHPNDETVQPIVADGAVVLVPGDHNIGHVDELNAFLEPLDWCLLIVTGDEEGRFRLSDVKHPNMRAWHMTGRPQIDEGARRFLGSGFTPGMREWMTALTDSVPPSVPEKPLDWCFMGQGTHQRRTECIDALGHTTGAAYLSVSDGFAEGIHQQDYWDFMAAAKIAPCPSGPPSPDSFRFHEALEAGCLPIADAQNPTHTAEGYWTSLFPVPAETERFAFPIIEDWSTLPDLMRELLDDWPANANRASAWWLGYKRTLARQLHSDIAAVSGLHPSPLRSPSERITAIVPTSPILAHPDTSAIEETIASIRHWLPDAEIIVTCDGVRPEQEELRPTYDEYLRRVLWLAHHHWHNVAVILSPRWKHQAGTTRAALAMVDTPYVLFVEHDTPLVTDREIDWPGILSVLDSDTANVVRFHHEAIVLEVHEHMMIDRESQRPLDVPMRRTVQWSQRPHLANAGLYRRILAEHFTDESRTMIEDTMHGVVHNAWREYGLAGWDRFRLWLYTPDDGSFVRSRHLDTRGAAPKYEMVP